MNIAQFKLAGIFAAAAMAAALTVSPAQAGANFDVDLSGQTGVLSLDIAMSQIPVGFLKLSGNIDSDVSAFNIVTDGYTFNLSDGSVSFLQFFNGKTVTGFDYLGSIGSGASKVTLSIIYNLAGGISSFELYKGRNPLRNIIEAGTPAITADVPEPASIWMVLMGLLTAGLAFAWRGKKRVSAAAV